MSMNNTKSPDSGSYNMNSPSSAGKKPNIKDMSTPSIMDRERMKVQSTTPSAGLTNVSAADNSPVNMNCPEPKPRGFRADQLVEMAGEDGYNLLVEEPRHSKFKG